MQDIVVVFLCLITLDQPNIFLVGKSTERSCMLFFQVMFRVFTTWCRTIARFRMIATETIDLKVSENAKLVSTDDQKMYP